VCLGDVYGGTFELLGASLSQVGITTTFLRADQAGQVPEALGGGTTTILLLETPANPTPHVFDIAQLARQARARGAAGRRQHLRPRRSTRTRSPTARTWSSTRPPSTWAATPT
jgi:hypothetical protein